MITKLHNMKDQKRPPLLFLLVVFALSLAANINAQSISVIGGGGSSFDPSTNETITGIWSFANELIIPNSTTLPATCTVGSIYSDTDSATKFSVCTATDTWTSFGSGIGGSTGSIDNAILRADSTGGSTVQSSGLIVTDALKLGLPDTSGTDTAGSPWYIIGQPGTGNATSGSIIFQTSTPTASGTTVQTQATRLTIATSGITSTLGITAPQLDINPAAVGNGLRFTGYWLATLTDGSAATGSNHYQLVFGRQGLSNTSTTGVLHGYVATPKTNGSGSPFSITKILSGTTYLNTGATAEVYLSLPSAASDYDTVSQETRFGASVVDTDGMRFTAAASQTLRAGESVTSAAGHFKSFSLGSSITLQSTSATTYSAVAGVGSWISDDGTGVHFSTSSSTQTIPDSGDGNPATVTITPLLAGLRRLTCSDADTCDVTMGETNVPDGTEVTFINMGTNVVDFADTAGVTELAGAFAMAEFDSLTLVYSSDRWIEKARSVN